MIVHALVHTELACQLPNRHVRHVRTDDDQMMRHLLALVHPGEGFQQNRNVAAPGQLPDKQYVRHVGAQGSDGFLCDAVWRLWFEEQLARGRIHDVYLAGRCAEKARQVVFGRLRIGDDPIGAASAELEQWNRA